jgi:hypothetical protein
MLLYQLKKQLTNCKFCISILHLIALFRKACLKFGNTILTGEGNSEMSNEKDRDENCDDGVYFVVSKMRNYNLY